LQQKWQQIQLFSADCFYAYVHVCLLVLSVLCYLCCQVSMGEPPLLASMGKLERIVMAQAAASDPWKQARDVAKKEAAATPEPGATAAGAAAAVPPAAAAAVVPAAALGEVAPAAAGAAAAVAPGAQAAAAAADAMDVADEDMDAAGADAPAEG
jgi:hypothetical protein